MMRQALTLSVLLVCLVTPALVALPVQAQTAPAADQTAPRPQTTRWLQIEAQPSLPEAQDRAAAWQALFGDVAGFSTGSGWYVITLGPYTEEQAALRMAELRAENLVPRDSFVSDGATYGPMFWPAPAVTPPPAEPAPAAAPETAAATEPEPEPAAAPQPAPASLLPDPALPDETADQARATEAALSQTDREDLQRALMWFGFYTASVDGAFGRGTRASMAAWQDANGYEPTGILTTAQRDGLLALYRAAQSAFGFETVTEVESGIEITLPLALVAFDHYEPPFVHYTAPDGGDTRLLLISQPGEEAALAALFDTLQTLEIIPDTGPRSLEGSSFSIRGETATRVTEAFATTARGMVKGWMVSWNPATTPDGERMVATLRASFRPIGDRALDPGLVPLTPAVQSGLLSGLAVKKPRLSRSGFYVDSSGAVLTTTEAVGQCARITLDRRIDATVAATDPASGLALLKPARPLAPAAFARFATGTTGTEIAVSGYSYGDTLPAPVLTFGSFAANEGLDGEQTLDRLALRALPGDTGGPVLTATGAVTGILLPRPAQGRILPQGVEFAAPPGVITPLMQSAGLTATPAPAGQPTLTPQDQASLATAMTVLVSCWD